MVIWIFGLLLFVACGDDATSAAVDADADAATGDPDAQGTDAPPSSSSHPLVTGGTFFRSYDATVWNNKNYPATIPDFRMRANEVTVAEFRAFVVAGGGTQASPPSAGDGAHPTIANSGWQGAWNTSLAADRQELESSLACSASLQTWTAAPGANEDTPINCVTWYEAMAFCAWDGGSLPTEAQWNYAASGGGEQRVYPWSSPPDDSAIDCTRANYYDCGNAPGAALRSPAGDSAWGHADLAGNISEWALDYYHDAYVVPCDDCANLTPSATRVYRGGNFSNIPDLLRSSSRSARSPDYRSAGIGIRCAYPL